MTVAAAVDRVLAALYARARPVKVVAAVTGGGSSAAELLFRAGSSSTMLSFAVPYSRASLLQFLGNPTDAPKFCAAETAERMAKASWSQALKLSRKEAEAETEGGGDLAAAVDRFRSAVGVGCTAALATNYSKKGPHEAFVAVYRATSGLGENEDVESVAPRCDTYHIKLDKAIGRSREEEDNMVSKWLVYALARAGEVDAAACATLYSALTSLHVGEDALHVVRRAADATVDVLGGICGETAGHGLASVCFLPGESAAVPVVAARGFAFRGVVLPGSFNPLHAGHVELAQAAQRKLLETTGREHPIGFELAVANADKGAIPGATVLARVNQFAPGSSRPSDLGAWPVVVTNAPLFGDKAELLPGCAFVVGADTAARLVDPKYYEQDPMRMALALQRIADRGCSFVVAGRVDPKTGDFVAAEDVLARCVPPLFRHLFVPLAERDFRNDVSSTLLRQRAAAAAKEH